VRESPLRSTLNHLTVAVLIAALAVLTPAAFSSPPDPTWIAGLYDDGDYDDVILLVTSSSSTSVERNDRTAGQLDLASDDLRCDLQICIDSPAVCLAFEGRAPPVA